MMGLREANYHIPNILSDHQSQPKSTSRFYLTNHNAAFNVNLTNQRNLCDPTAYHVARKHGADAGDFMCPNTDPF